MRTISVTILLAVVACASRNRDETAKPPEPAATRTPDEPPAVERPKPPPLDPALTADTEACGDATCVAPEQCLEYPTMGAQGATIGRECGVRCDPARSSADCPDGRRCVPIPDGPGSVCR